MEELKKISSSANSDATLLVLTDDSTARATVESSLTMLDGRFTVWLAHTGRIPGSDLLPYAHQMLQALNQQTMKQTMKRASLVALNGACNLATVMLSINPQAARRAIFIDPPGRPRPHLFTRLRETLQRVLTVPLPFQCDPDLIDLRHMQHRISCPLLVVRSPELEPWWAKQCEELAHRAPSAWLMTQSAVTSAELPRESGVRETAMQSPRFTPDFLDLLEQFIQVPSKRPQKNLSAAKPPKVAAAEPVALERCSNT